MSGLNKWVRVGVLGALGGLALAGAQSTEAQACGGAWIPEIEQQIDHRVPGIARAEKMLEKGHYEDAAASIIRMMPHIKSLSVQKHSALVRRALRVLAVGTARADGGPDIEAQLPRSLRAEWVSRNRADRQAQLSWAAGVLTEVNGIKKNDPVAQTQLAEALARIDGRQDEAFTILDGLAKKDLVASPEGYSALASLQQARGNSAGQKLALKRCAEMAPSSKLCGRAHS